MTDYPLSVARKTLKNATDFPVHNPYDNSLVATTALASKDHLEQAITAALESQAALKALPTYQRAAILQQIANRLRADQERLAKILAAEAGKPLIYARAEIERGAQTFQVAAEETKRWPGEVLSLDWTAPGTGKEGIVKYFPVGPVAGISPFNFPLNLAAHKVAPAMAAACPIVLKPASATPLSALELAKIIDQTDWPAGAVSVLPMDRQTGQNLVTDERFNLLSFTGSPSVGWEMKAQAGKKKVVLELGGNAGVVVTPSGDWKKAVQECVVGGFSYSGQVCIHVQRIFVHQSLFADFSAEFLSQIKALKIGSPLDPTTQFAGLIDQKNTERVATWVTEAQDNGAQVLTGGSFEGTVHQPTVLTNTNPSLKVVAEEVFGPVVCLEPYEDFSAVIEQLNTSRFGLQAGVFTNQLSEVRQAWNQLEMGGVLINSTPLFRVDHMPYGGVKDSGLGREGVKYALAQDYLEPRLLVLGS